MYLQQPLNMELLPPKPEIEPVHYNMLYQQHIPKAPLQHYVESISYIEGNNKGTALPKIAMSLVFNLADHFKLYSNQHFTHHIDYKRHWVAGLQTKPTYVESYGTSKMLVIQFKPLGACIFLKEPLHHFSNDYITLDHVFGQEADITWEQLQEAASLGEQMLIVENFLYRRLLSNKLPHQKLIATIETMFSVQPGTSITQLCSQLNISRKHLNHLSKEYAGVSPKTLFSLHRLQKNLKAISATPNTKLTSVAYQQEYFDQAHFINDFKKFTRLSPTEYANIVANKPGLKIVPHYIPFL